MNHGTVTLFEVIVKCLIVSVAFGIVRALLTKKNWP